MTSYTAFDYGIITEAVDGDKCRAFAETEHTIKPGAQCWKSADYGMNGARETVCIRHGLKSGQVGKIVGRVVRW